MAGRRRGEHRIERRRFARGTQPLQPLDPTQLLDVGDPIGKRGRDEPRRAFGGSLQAVRGQIFGDALGVPRRRGERPHREREGVHALVHQEVPAIGGVRLVEQPEAVVQTEPVGELGDVRGQQAGNAKALAIHDQAAAGTPRRQ